MTGGRGCIIGFPLSVVIDVCIGHHHTADFETDAPFRVCYDKQGYQMPAVDFVWAYQDSPSALLFSLISLIFYWPPCSALKSETEDDRGDARLHPGPDSSKGVYKKKQR